MKLDSVRELKSILLDSLLLTTDSGTGIRSRIASDKTGCAILSDGDQSPPVDLALGVASRTAGNYRLAVRVQRRTLRSQTVVEAIQKKAKGETDVRYIGAVTKRASGSWHQRRNRPLLLGSSVGHYLVTAGTLGGFVTLRKDQGVHLLSNNHVLANENRAKAGDPILQPGVHDGGKNPRDIVARLSTYVRLKKRGVNVVDAALAALEDKINFHPAELTGIGTLKGVGADLLDEGTEVAKLGRTTGLTRGRVTAFELDDVKVGFDGGVSRFDGQIEIEGVGHVPFSDGGDSGSLIMDRACYAVGLLFAGSDQGGANGQGLTFVNPISTVLDLLNADLLV